MSTIGTSLLLLFLCNFIDAVQITIKQGTLEGFTSKSRSGIEFCSFYGIPFAKPPVGELRFEPPKEPDSWQGIRDAQIPPPICIQSNPFNPNSSLNSYDEIAGQEDCLFLNVFTPSITFSSLLPVMVYIHGGGFFTGCAALHGPEYFMDHPVIVVSIQYRLAIFGFLSAADEILPGNMGMKDQVQALKWIQQNIASFGGDPKRVTIVGESAGGASVHLHMHSPLSTGLFHQAISQSGSALAPWALTTPQKARQRLQALGVLSACRESSIKELVKCLRKLPASQLVLAHNKFYTWDLQPVVPFPIVVESKKVEGAFMVEDPWKQDVVNNVPWIIGVVHDEGGVIATRILSKPTTMNQWTQHYDNLMPLAFYYTDWTDEKKAPAITVAIKNFYFGDEEISMKNGKKLIDLFSHGYFVADCMEGALRQSRRNNVYFYLYNHRNTYTFNEIFGNVDEDLGVCHADDLLSFFHILGLFPPVTEGDDFLVSQKMVEYWVNFIHKGDPNGEEKIWQPIQSQNFEYLHIKTNSYAMEKNLFEDEYNFWKNTLFSLRSTQINSFHSIKEEL